MADRPRAWADRRLLLDLTPSVPQHFNLLLNAPTVDTLTAVRIIVHFTLNLSFPWASVTTWQVVDFGIGVASVEAFTAGGASLPAVDSETQFPPRGWLWKDQVSIGMDNQVGDETGPYYITEVKADLRAARKIDKGVLFLTIESNLIDGSGTNMVCNGIVRSLCLT